MDFLIRIRFKPILVEQELALSRTIEFPPHRFLSTPPCANLSSQLDSRSTIQLERNFLSFRSKRTISHSTPFPTRNSILQVIKTLINSIHTETRIVKFRWSLNRKIKVESVYIYILFLHNTYIYIYRQVWIER